MNKCIIKDCVKEIHARGLCPMHYDRLLTHGNPLKTKWRPKGSGQIFHGYKLITVNGKQVREHRVIMEQKLNRKLLPFPLEIVHHKNGNRLDNRIENLELETQSTHSRNIFIKSIIKNNKKLCTKCNKFLILEEFHKYKKGLKSICKSCHKKHYPR